MRWPLQHWLKLSTCLCLGAGVVVLALLLIFWRPARMAAVIQPKDRSIPRISFSEVRRLPLAGAKGSTLVLEPSGQAFVEEASGRRILVHTTGDSVPDEEAIAKAVSERMAQKPTVNGPKQLVVLDEGAVMVPQGAIITYADKDHLVAMETDGSVTAYYVDGRVEKRERRNELPAKPKAETKP